jgi:diguanylate cyclase (GGDEF)-like protein
MSKQERGALTQWMRDVAMAERDSLAPYRDRIMLSMGFVAILLLVPFAINNFIQERFAVAMMLLVILVIMLVDVYALWRGRPAPIPYALLLPPFLVGITAAVVSQGVPGILWSYPVVVFCYFLLGRRTAIVCSLALLLYVTALTLYFIDFALALRLFGTLLLTIIMINIVLNVISDLHQTLANQALSDPLTGAFNRRFMEQCLDDVVARAERHPLVATVLMIDVDHFKSVNDRYGHDQGDLVLKHIVSIVVERKRRGDRLFRWGGEEFLLLLEGADVHGAGSVAEIIRYAIEDSRVLPQQPVTVSIGVAQYVDSMSVDAWTKAADAALYRAKAAGRNRVERAAP